MRGTPLRCPYSRPNSESLIPANQSSRIRKKHLRAMTPKTQQGQELCTSQPENSRRTTKALCSFRCGGIGRHIEESLSSGVSPEDFQNFLRPLCCDLPATRHLPGRGPANHVQNKIAAFISSSQSEYSRCFASSPEANRRRVSSTMSLKFCP